MWKTYHFQCEACQGEDEPCNLEVIIDIGKKENPPIPDHCPFDKDDVSEWKLIK